jgi:hypothetical protein
MTEDIGNMKNKILFSLLVIGISSSLVYGDNEVYVDQSGNNASIDLEQLGSNNLIGGTQAVSGTMTFLDLDGVTMALDINQIGSSNIFRSDAIDGDNFTGFFEYDGDSNVWDLLVNSSGLIASDYINMNIDVTRPELFTNKSQTLESPSYSKNPVKLSPSIASERKILLLPI